MAEMAWGDAQSVAEECGDGGLWKPGPFASYGELFPYLNYDIPPSNNEATHVSFLLQVLAKLKKNVENCFPEKDVATRDAFSNLTSLPVDETVRDLVENQDGIDALFKLWNDSLSIPQSALAVQLSFLTTFESLISALVLYPGTRVHAHRLIRRLVGCSQAPITTFLLIHEHSIPEHLRTTKALGQRSAEFEFFQAICSFLATAVNAENKIGIRSACRGRHLIKTWNPDISAKKRMASTARYLLLNFESKALFRVIQNAPELHRIDERKALARLKRYLIDFILGVLRNADENSKTILLSRASWMKFVIEGLRYDQPEVVSTVLDSIKTHIIDAKTREIDRKSLQVIFDADGLHKLTAASHKSSETRKLLIELITRRAEDKPGASPFGKPQDPELLEYTKTLKAHLHGMVKPIVLHLARCYPDLRPQILRNLLHSKLLARAKTSLPFVSRLACALQIMEMKVPPLLNTSMASVENVTEMLPSIETVLRFIFPESLRDASAAMDGPLADILWRCARIRVLRSALQVLRQTEEVEEVLSKGSHGQLMIDSLSRYRGDLLCQLRKFLPETRLVLADLLRSIDTLSSSEGQERTICLCSIESHLTLLQIYVDIFPREEYAAVPAILCQGPLIHLDKNLRRVIANTLGVLCMRGSVTVSPRDIHVVSRAGYESKQRGPLVLAMLQCLPQFDEAFCRSVAAAKIFVDEFVDKQGFGDMLVTLLSSDIRKQCGAGANAGIWESFGNQMRRELPHLFNVKEEREIGDDDAGPERRESKELVASRWRRSLRSRVLHDKLSLDPDAATVAHVLQLWPEVKNLLVNDRFVQRFRRELNHAPTPPILRWVLQLCSRRSLEIPRHCVQATLNNLRVPTRSGIAMSVAETIPASVSRSEGFIDALRELPVLTATKLLRRFIDSMPCAPRSLIKFGLELDKKSSQCPGVSGFYSSIFTKDLLGSVVLRKPAKTRVIFPTGKECEVSHTIDGKITAPTAAVLFVRGCCRPRIISTVLGDTCAWTYREIKDFLLSIKPFVDCSTFDSTLNSIWKKIPQTQRSLWVALHSDSRISSANGNPTNASRGRFHRDKNAADRNNSIATVKTSTDFPFFKEARSLSDAITRRQELDSILPGLTDVMNLLPGADRQRLIPPESQHSLLEMLNTCDSRRHTERLECLLALLRWNPRVLCPKLKLKCLVQDYGGLLIQADQTLLEIFQMCELHTNIPVSSYMLLWNSKNATFPSYEAKFLMGECIRRVDPVKMQLTCQRFSSTETLDMVAGGISERWSRDRGTYDWRFFTPLLGMVLGWATAADVLDIAASGWLGLPIVLLSSHEACVRNLGYKILDECWNALDTDEEIPLLHSLVKILDNLRCELADRDKTRLFPITAKFMSWAIYVGMTPENPLFPLVNAYFMEEGRINMISIPHIITTMMRSVNSFQSKASFAIIGGSFGTYDDAAPFFREGASVFDELFTAFSCSTKPFFIKCRILRIFEQACTSADVCRQMWVETGLRMALDEGCRVLHSEKCVSEAPADVHEFRRVMESVLDIIGGHLQGLEDIAIWQPYVMLLESVAEHFPSCVAVNLFRAARSCTDRITIRRWPDVNSLPGSGKAPEAKPMSSYLRELEPVTCLLGAVLLTAENGIHETYADLSWLLRKAVESLRYTDVVDWDPKPAGNR